jgi:hypothetical protein
MVFGCPLCELYNTAENRSCFGCPLFFDGRKDPVKCSDIQHHYIKWAHAASKRRRKRYATAIVKLLKGEEE